MEHFELSALPIRRYEHRIWDSGRWEGFDPRAGDVLVCTPYKAGTTWMQMICALLIFQRAEFDRPLAEISPWLELKGNSAEHVHALFRSQTHRRIIKSHTALDGLPWLPQATYICVERDPRDIVISMLNQIKNFNPNSDAMFAREMRRAETTPPPVPDDEDAFFQKWLSEGSFPWETDGAPYWSVFRHGASFWMHRHEPNIIMVHYNDLTSGLDAQMRRIADALDIEIDESIWPVLVQAARFENMKINADRLAPDTNFNMWKSNAQFFNKGASGQWRGIFSHESLSIFERVTATYPADYIRWLLKGSSEENKTGRRGDE